MRVTTRSSPGRRKAMILASLDRPWRRGHVLVDSAYGQGRGQR
jgi:hypothetical protein